MSISLPLTPFQSHALGASSQAMMEVRLSGVAPLKQFYGYGGRSDADTMTFLPERAAWRPHGESEWRSIPLDFFRNAAVDAGRGERKPILRPWRIGPLQDEAMTLRLQGIDAPELHYEAIPALGPRGPEPQSLDDRAGLGPAFVL